MRINVISPKAEIIHTSDDAVSHLELAGRTCYKSEAAITNVSADKFVRKICRNRHESVLEHATMTARIVCSRACSHQLVRHRIAAYSQESQRYVNYQKRGYEVICPPSWGVPFGEYEMLEYGGYDGHGWSPREYPKPTTDETLDEQRRLGFLAYAFEAYEEALTDGQKPEDARYILPNAAKTEIVMTCNFRVWRHVFRERALNAHAQWEIRSIMLFLFTEMDKMFPAVFDDLHERPARD